LSAAKQTTVLQLQERTPIHNAEVEMSCLGAMMLSAKMSADVGQRLDPEDFYRPVHQTIFRALRRLTLKGIPPDMVTIPDELGAELENVGGFPYLWQIAEAVPTAHNGLYYAGIVKDLAAERRLENAALEILGFTRDTTMEPSEKISRSVGLVGSVRTSDTAFKPVSETIFDGKREPRQALATPWEGLNNLTSHGGLTKGEPHGLMADTGAGKTYFATQLARHWCKQGLSVGFVSLEMSRQDLQDRMVFQEIGVWNEGHANAIGIPDKFVEKQREMATWGLEIADYSTFRLQDINLEGIVCDIEAIHASTRLDALIIDYLQLLKPKQWTRPFEALAEAAHTVRWLAKRTGICVVGLLQAKQKDGELLERGSLEIRDTMATMLAIERKEPGKGEPGFCRFRPLKMRHGAKGVIDLEFTDRFEFRELAQPGMDEVWRGGE